MVVTKQNKVGNLNSEDDAEHYVDSYKFRGMVEKISQNYKELYGSKFLFGWTGTPNLANSIAMERLPIPCFLVVNTSSMNHYLPSEAPHEISEKSLLNFLDSVLKDKVPVSN